MRLHLVESGAGPVVVLLHGFPLDHTMWEFQRAPIEERHRLILPDLRGQGASDAPEGIYPVDDLADDVIELLDTLKVGEPIVLGGLSMGGYVALSIAVRHPKRLRGLMLMNTKAGGDSPEAAQNREHLAQQVEAAGNVDAVVSAMLPKLLGRAGTQGKAALMERLRAQMSRTAPRGAAGTLRGLAVRPDRTGDLGRITIPTLVLAGLDDQVIPPDESRRLAERLPMARLEIIAGTGHLAPLENPKTTTEAIVRFLEGLA